MNSTYKNILAIAAILIGFQSVSVAQVKIGNNPANIVAGSALEIESTDKGLRMPQVALTSTTTFAPIAGVGADASSMGMHVFNTSSVITSGIASNGKAYPAAGIGEYYWDGFGWVSSSVQSGSGGFSLVWAGYSPGPFNYVNNLPGSDLNTTETFDTFNANTGGVFTVPVDGYYTIAQNFMVDLVGSGAGNFNSSIVITSFSTGVPESRISNNTGSVNGNRTYSLGNNLTVKLFTGDLVKFTVQPCNGCSGSNYRVRLVSQTIGLFQ
ncbi:hypothetical protein [Dyadobacter sp. OTU695]|uniref:hypothetical protein n=1 Tax=Dyadobacter sp. OTU695 TaxID=3043860 RepID=UPI00313DBD54